MKDETGLHFLGWAILANVTADNLVSIACSAIAATYACVGVYETWKNRGERK